MRSLTALSVLLVVLAPLGQVLGQGGSDSLWKSASETPKWRSVGPALMSGRVVDVAVDPSDPSTVYAAAASGGLWKTTNRGTKWKPVFDDQDFLSIGDVALSPSEPDTIWVGTGEANNQRSSYWGNGVYKSEDGGKTWNHMGLPESHHIGRIAIHPTNPNVVYVAALGHLYSANAERGLYRSRDGGASFKLVKAISEDAGAVDVLIDWENPDTVFMASYERRRRAWHFDAGGEGSRIYRSKDGGDSWEQLGGGLPSGELGRIGLAQFRGDAKILYACIENLNPQESKIPEADDAANDDEEPVFDPGGHRYGDGLVEGEVESAPGAKAAPKPLGGEVYRSDDGGDTWLRVNKKAVGGKPGYYYGQIRIDPNDADRVWILGVRVYHTKDGGKTWKSDGAPGIHVDHHALWIDPNDSDHMLLGNDGGLCRSYDGGKTWDLYENLPISQFYAVGVDQRHPYRIYGGLQDNGSFGLPSQGSTNSGIYDREVYRVNGGDGFYCAVDPTDPMIVYSESQFGRPSRLNLSTQQRKGIRPRGKKGEPKDRFNWMTPLVISHHNSRTLYYGSQRLWRSVNRGDDWEAVSGDLSTNDPAKIKGNVPHCTITTVSESPIRSQVIWLGTDDGKVWVTQDGCQHWRDLSDFFPDVVQGLWVSRVEASPHNPGTAYVSFTGYREDHFAPHLFMTDDYGGTWTPLTEGLPKTSPINVVREDPKRAGLLYVGTEHGAFMSPDEGGRWWPLSNGMPKVAVHDLVIHDRDSDLIAGTHGRGIYVLDIAAIRALTPEALQGQAALLPPKIVLPARGGFARGYAGARSYRASNPRSGATLNWWLAKAPKNGEVEIEIRDALGKVVRSLTLDANQGLNTVRWNLRRAAPPRRRGQRQGQRRRQGSAVAPGDYLAVLMLGDEEWVQPITIRRRLPTPGLFGTESEEDDEGYEGVFN